MICATVAPVRAAELLRVNIQRLMQAEGLGPVAFSERIGKKKNWVSKLFSDKPSGSPEETPAGTTLATLDAIAEAFGLHVSALLAEDLDASPSPEESTALITLPLEAMTMVVNDNHVRMLLALLAGIDPIRRTVLLKRFIHEATAPDGPAADSSVGRTVQRNGP